MYRDIKSVYFSPTKTTKKIVKEISLSIGEKTVEYDITLPDSRERELSFSENDIVVIGVPVYAGRVPEFIEEYFSKLSGNGALGIAVVVYGNRDYDDALLELRDLMVKSEFKLVGAGAFIGEHSYSDKIATGRPDRDDIASARKFGERVKEKLSTLENANQTEALNVRGNYPYKERGSIGEMAPDTSENCAECGICAANCPVGAISFEDYSLVDEKKCIKCHSCVKNCPVGAKTLDNEVIVGFRKGLIERVGTGRKYPEVFI